MHTTPLRAVPLLLLLLWSWSLVGCGSEDTSDTGGEGGSPAACIAGETRCEGQVPQTCNDEGTWSDGEACDFVCNDGSCIGTCVPGTQQCDGLVPQTCTDEGTWLGAEPCESTCNAGQCTGVCVPGSRECDGLTPKTCSAEGAWIGDAPCDFVCSEGACTGSCVPGSARCDDLVPQTCSDEGAWIGDAPCDFLCSDGACTGSCVPGSIECDGSVLKTCRDEGSWVEETCDFVCSEGACSGVCIPGSQQCDGLVPQACNEDGEWVSLDACEFVCSEGECTGSCVPDSQRCDGLVPQACSAAGDWVGDEPCDFLCNDGQCTGVCHPGEQGCTDETTLETCDENGAWQTSTCLQLCSSRTEDCACLPGYVGDGIDCEPIDFCTGPEGGCSPNATCSQIDATPTCTCNPGFSGDGYTCSPVPTVVLDEGFDDINQLSVGGWLMANRSAPLGVNDWFQGNSDQVFPSADGAPNAYIAANFNSTTGSGTISTWLATPHFSFGALASVSFQTRRMDSEYPDRIEVRLCALPPCGLPTDGGVGNYTTLLGTVNPALQPDGYPTAWTRFAYTNANGIPTSGAGRVAIRYYVTQGGPTGSNSDYIGIDRFVASVGTPAYSVGGSVSGLAGGSVILWLNGADQLPVAADGNFRFPRNLDSGTAYAVRIYEQPAGQNCIIMNAAGSITSENIDDVQVVCSPE